MLQAYNQAGEPVILAYLDRSTVETMRTQQSFYCPVCGERVAVKAGRSKIAHFSHKPHSNCSVSKGEGEYHEKGKLQLFEWLVDQGLEANLEKHLPEINRRADILVRIGKKAVALEFQCAALNRKELSERTDDYRKLGIEPLWILGGNRLKRTGAAQIRMTSVDQSFLSCYQENDQPLINFFCPNSRQFCLFRHVQSSGNGRFHGDLHFLSLNKCRILYLFHPSSKQDTASFWYNWLKDKQMFRTKPPPNRQSRQQLSWSKWLYQKKYHQSLLPSLIHLPVTGQYRMKTPPWNWQSRLCLDFLVPLPVQRVVPIKPIYRLLHDVMMPPSDFPLIKCSADPVREYLELLEKLEIISFVNEQEIQKQIPIKFPENVEQALHDDRMIIQFLKLKNNLTSQASTRMIE
ncbi:competence protein CoiA [Virgibacillus senegalensis]|uniref:competence protein CoiA n=1 Tax=Virgibacillus senegalensis TaxID=1499679 RepID=UPI00069DBB79|nr:competence protein CoiA family protein [Virgibacillus senegalensis]